MASPTREKRDSRPQTNGRHPTAPTVMTVNGHFANVGDAPSSEQYAHGIQVIDEDQNFKYGERELSPKSLKLILQL